MVFLYGKSGHGALVGLTFVKGTSVDTLFHFFEKRRKMWFLALVGLTTVKGRSVWKQVTKKVAKGMDSHTLRQTIFGAILHHK